jgi:glycosyltransferase involved in cell wall biosynthesis
MANVPVSVLIPTKNEAANIVACIRSVTWASEVVVVDSDSTDGTPALAESEGARVVQFRYVPGGSKKKNWALENVDFKNEWIFILDADERVTPALAMEIANLVVKAPPEHGWYVNRRFYFLGRWVRHAGYFPSWNLRLLRKGHGAYERLTDFDSASGDNEVHEHVVLDGPAGFLRRPMDHFAFPSIEVFVEKHNRYSNWEARLDIHKGEGNSSAGESSIIREARLKRRLRTVARRFPFPHWLRFFYHFVLRRGFLDGVTGYVFCHLLAEYEFLIWAKARELRTHRQVQETRIGLLSPGASVGGDRARRQ